MASVIYILQYVAFFCWLCSSILVATGLAGLLYKPKRKMRRAENVEYVIVSIANHKVEKTLTACIAHTKQKLGKRPIVLVDEESELIPNLKANSLVVVPSSYRRDLVGKGRAINYFIETEVKPDKWYAFVDDDNLILDDSFLYEIPYYEERGYVAMNAVLVPRKGRSKLTYCMDFIRYFDDLTTYRLSTGLLKRAILGLHGELLTVKGSTLREIGYNSRTIVEDFHFASQLVQRGYKTWQSATKVSIKSPNSLCDLMRQRGRWYIGILNDLKHCPLSMKLLVGVRVVLWSFGIFGSWALSPLWPFWGWFPLAIPGAIYYWTVYLYGVWKLRKPHYLFLIPLFGIFEAVSVFVGLRQKGKGFVVIAKD